MIRHWVLTLLLTGVGLTAHAQKNLILKKDLQPDWLMNATGAYETYSDSNPVHTIYFSLNPEKYKGDYLVIESENQFTLMINGKLILDQQTSTTLPVDSMRKLFTQTSLFFAVHQDEEIDQSNLATGIYSLIISNPTQSKEEFFLRKESFFRDFVLTISLTLFIFLISIMRLNPRLSSDYFSFTKIFSLRDYENDQFYYRLTSGAFLFYVFTSLILAFYIIVINQFAKTGVGAIEVSGYMVSLLTWLKIAAVIVGFLFLKLLIIHTIAPLFGVRDVAGFHFFNFIRLLLISLGILTLTMVIYYVLHGQRSGFYSFLYQVLLWILGGWVILLFLKLVNRVQYSVFHIFSYICATEIIPFLLIIKVLNE